MTFGSSVGGRILLSSARPVSSTDQLCRTFQSHGEELWVLGAQICKVCSSAEPQDPSPSFTRKCFNLKKISIRQIRALFSSQLFRFYLTLSGNLIFFIRFRYLVW